MAEENDNAHFLLALRQTLYGMMHNSSESRSSLRINPQSARALGSCALFSTILSKSLALFRKLFQQRCGLPGFTMLALEFTDAVVNPFEAHCVGIPHRTAAISGEAVAVDINDVDV